MRNGLFLRPNLLEPLGSSNCYGSASCGEAVSTNIAPLARFLYLVRVGKQEFLTADDIFHPLPGQTFLPQGKDRRRLRFGTSGGGRNLFSEVWTDEHHVFRAEGGVQPEAERKGTGASQQLVDEATEPTTRQQGDKPVDLGSPHRTKRTVLRKHPVDVLLVEEDTRDDFSATTRFWEVWLQHCPASARPDLVAVCTDPNELVVDGGFHSKVWRQKFETLGYQPGFWFLRATDHGGVVRQDRLVLILERQGSGRPRLEHEPVPMKEGTLRSATNMLKTHLIPFNAWNRQGWEEAQCDPTISHAAAPCKIVGTARADGKPVFCPQACLPDGAGSWIRTTDRRGVSRVRRLLTEELAKAKGVPPNWIQDCKTTTRMVDNLTTLHIWAAIGDTIRSRWCDQGCMQVPDAMPTMLPVSWMEATEDVEEDEECDWVPPDLSEGGDWHRERVRTLEVAIAGWSDATRLRKEGLEALERHRENYGPEGPKHLQLLWWEFPPEHWEELRDGCPMNFLTEPSGDLVMNQEMDPEAKGIATDFVNELVRLGVLRALPDGSSLKANAPLFCVPKEGQPGQWRPIADMKRGGQNAHIGKDPVHLPRPEDILHRMYTGGYTAVVDASKFFYNFPTAPRDQAYLGCIHPETGQHLCYFGLPMGSSSSPGLAGRYGSSLVRQTRERALVFQGILQDNGWRAHLEDEPFDPHKGIGLVVMGADGLPAALMWIHVDDIAIHAPTKAKCKAAVDEFMNAALRVGLICQPCKTRPPSQRQKYCGFIYDTTGIPCICIPQDKIDRSVAGIRFLRSGAACEALSRLTLAVVVGRLQSLVGATPYNIGQTYLRRLYDRLHDLTGLTETTTAASFYYTVVSLTEEEWLDLDWWLAALLSSPRRYARSRNQSVVGVTWGDGSGTGTGGTLQLVPAGGGSMAVETWMGVWEPQVFHFTSNWKELRTLLRTLEQEAASERLCGCTIFYFTDNIVTYYVAHSGGSSVPALHRLIRELKKLELLLDVHLEVVHVPGKHMITQQTDGLSRGLAFSNGRSLRSPEEEVTRLFRGVDYTPALVPWVMHVSGRSWRHRPLKPMDSLKNWRFQEVVHESTVWTPLPEWADQIILAVLNVWIEQPWSTEAYFLVPRIFQRRWGHKSKYIRELAIVDAREVPGGQNSDIPVVVLHLPCFTRSLPSPSMDRPTVSHGPKWHSEQADYVRGL